MKKTFLLFALFVSGSSLIAQTNSVQPTQTSVFPLEKRVEFINGEYKLGKITLNKPVEFTIEMKNIGTDSVTLINVQAGCGCTAPNFTPNEKFGPGQTSKILIRYNGSTSGPFTKFSTIYFDNGQSKQVSFSGEGIPETPAAAPTAVSKPATTPAPVPVSKTKTTKN